MKRITIHPAAVILAALLVAALTVNLCASTIATAQGAKFTAWVLCKPLGSVNVRSRPDVSGAKTGRLYLGDTVLIDNTTKKGAWVHSSDLPTDEGTGWISGSYITTDPVELVHMTMRVDANGRVAAWDGMNCRNRACWLQPGDEVQVYAVSGIWAVTDKGFVKLEYLLG